MKLLPTDPEQITHTDASEGQIYIKHDRHMQHDVRAPLPDDDDHDLSVYIRRRSASPVFPMF